MRNASIIHDDARVSEHQKDSELRHPEERSDEGPVEHQKDSELRHPEERSDEGPVEY